MALLATQPAPNTADPATASRPLNQRIALIATIAALATVYVGAARLGLTFDAVAGFATLVWPPTGIALAALLILGYRVWPGIFAGALIANMLTGGKTPILPVQDLAHMGYKIAESYYKNALDKKQAVRDILEIKDFKEFLKASRYEEKFQAGR